MLIVSLALGCVERWLNFNSDSVLAQTTQEFWQCAKRNVWHCAKRNGNETILDSRVVSVQWLKNVVHRRGDLAAGERLRNMLNKFPLSKRAVAQLSDYHECID